jgi:DNA invertase Pin-like site-specific DNA recombinase
MTRSSHEGHGKIRPHHLERSAFVYIRQSSLYQVEHHVESKRRQYDLVTWAAEVGWPRERIVLVDDDQGSTATIAYARGGFGRVATAVGRGEAGIVVGLEVARLARNSPDWHHLMYVCRWTDTLMADEHAVYDLALAADRMVLGLRGQMSELEMDLSIHRMVAARWNKARRGDVMTIPPAGYEVNDLGEFVRTSDEAVAHAIGMVFAKFDELGSARQVWLWFCAQGLQLPVRRVELRSHPVLWMAPTYRGSPPGSPVSVSFPSASTPYSTNSPYSSCPLGARGASRAPSRSR